MTKEEKEQSKTEDRISESQNENYRTIFSYKEIESIVKSFILGYIRGQIKIEFVSANHIITGYKIHGKEITVEEAGQKVLETTKNLSHLIEICCGIQPSTQEELKKAVYSMFSQIVSFRHGRRIEGDFIPIEVEQRLDELEKKYSATDNLLTELIKWLTEEAKTDDSMYGMRK